MIRKYKGKPLTVPLAASVIAFGLALSGCDDKTVTQANASTTVAPKSTVSGLVQDTNGAPLQGFTVSLLGKKTTTDASGTYVFTNVAVQQVVGADGSANIKELSVVITPPAGSNYIGAVVTVRPEAQIDGNGEDHAANLASRLLAGLNVAAGTAVLPSRTSTVNGVLRNKETGEPLAGVKVALDLVAVGLDDVPQEQEQNDVATTYSAPVMFTTTGADGSFSFANVPGDSTLRLQAENWQDAGMCAIETNDEEVILNIGDCNVEPIVSSDSIAPVIVKVQDAIGNVLNLDENGEVAAINLVLSEAVTGDLTVPRAAYVAVNNQYVSGTFSLVNSKVVNFVPDAPIAGDSTIHVSILRSALKDLAGNYLDGDVNSDFAFDDFVGTSDSYLQVMLKSGGNPVGAAVTPVQLMGAAHSDTELIFGIGNDVNADDDDIQYLDNVADNDSPADGQDAFDRVDDLLQAISGKTLADASFARVQWEINDAAVEYTVVHRRGSQQVTDFTQDNDDAFGGVITVDFSDAQPGDLIQVTATDALGAQFTSVVELVDHVGPIPVMQDAYLYEDVLTAGVVLFGDGGELVGSQAVGETNGVVFPVSRGLLIDADIYNDPTNVPNGVPDGVNSIRDARNFGLPTNGAFFDVTQVAYTGIADGVLYDTTAISGWLNSLSRDMGIAFSEDLADSISGVAYSGSASITGWRVVNDIKKDLRQGDVNVDLAVFTANPVVMQGDHNDTFNFAGAVTDVSGNAAPSANVVVRDLLPPFVVAATLTGNNAADGVADNDTTATLNLEFNEPIAQQAVLDGESITLYGNGASLSVSLTGATRSTSGMTLSIPGVDATHAVFDLPLEAQAPEAGKLDHYYAVEFDAIPDAYGNTWADTMWGNPYTPHATVKYSQ